MAIIEWRHDHMAHTYASGAFRRELSRILSIVSSETTLRALRPAFAFIQLVVLCDALCSTSPPGWMIPTGLQKKPQSSWAQHFLINYCRFLPPYYASLVLPVLSGSTQLCFVFFSLFLLPRKLVLPGRLPPVPDLMFPADCFHFMAPSAHRLLSELSHNPAWLLPVPLSIFPLLFLSDALQAAHAVSLSSFSPAFSSLPV